MLNNRTRISTRAVTFAILATGSWACSGRVVSEQPPAQSHPDAAADAAPADVVVDTSSPEAEAPEAPPPRPPNHLEGTMDKNPAFAVGSALALRRAEAPDGILVALFADVLTCDQVQTPPLLERLTPKAYAVAATFGASTVGSYTLVSYSEVEPSEAQVVWFQNEGTTSWAPAVEGTAEITSSDASGARGRFDVRFPRGELVKGWFDAPYCDVPW